MAPSKGGHCDFKVACLLLSAVWQNRACMLHLTTLFHLPCLASCHSCKGPRVLCINRLGLLPLSCSAVGAKALIAQQMLQLLLCTPFSFLFNLSLFDVLKCGSTVLSQWYVLCGMKRWFCHISWNFNNSVILVFARPKYCYFRSHFFVLEVQVGNANQNTSACVIFHCRSHILALGALHWELALRRRTFHIHYLNKQMYFSVSFPLQPHVLSHGVC